MINSNGILYDGLTSDPTTLIDGLTWYRDDLKEYRRCLNGVIQTITIGGGGANRSDYVLVKSKSDLPSPVGGVITLVDNYSYEINGTISLGTDRIVCGVSNIIFGIDKSNDVLFYTGTGDMITSVNNSLSIRNISLAAVSVGSKVLNLTGSGIERVEIAENVFGNSISIGIVSGFSTIVFRGNLSSGCADGLEIDGLNGDVFITDNPLENFVGTATAIKLSPLSSYDTVIISRNMFEMGTGQIALDIDASVIVVDGGLITINAFEGLGTALFGINALQSGWEIKAGDNIGLTGLLELNIPLSLSATSTTSKYSTYGSSGQSVFIDLPNELNEGSDTIQANLQVEAKISDGSSWWADLYNFTDSDFIDAPNYPFEFNKIATSSDLYESGQSGFIDLPSSVHGKSLGAVMCGGAGGGNRTTTLLNAILKLKIYKA